MARRKNKTSENQFLRSLDGVAYGLFCSEVMGYFILWIGNWFHFPLLSSWGQIITGLAGSAVGIGVAYATGARGIALICSALAGAICQESGVSWVFLAYISVMVSVYVGEFIRNKTPIDIFITPILTVATACLVSNFVAPYANQLIYWCISQISIASSFSPLFMGMLVASMMAVLSIFPIPMVSVCAIANLSFLGTGAALAGTCGTMLGLAMMSVDDNDLGDVVAIGIGTPVLQLKNCIKNPILFIPVIVSALVTGPLSSCLFKLGTNIEGVASGCLMFEGPLSVIEVMGKNAWLGMLIVDVLLPILICFSVYRALKKLGWIKAGDLRINHL